MAVKELATLILSPVIPKEVVELKKQFEKNIPIPDARGRHGNWDHLITAFTDEKSLVMPHKRANSLAVRARALGYVSVIRKVTDEESRIWIEGVDYVTPHRGKTGTKRGRRKRG